MQYYWPGEGVLQWVGVSSGSSGDVAGALGSTFLDIRSSNWQSLPLIAVDLGPPPDADPTQEATWLSNTFQGVLPTTFPEVRAFAVSYPARLHLYSPDSISAYRRAISSNPYFKSKLRLVQ